MADTADTSAENARLVTDYLKHAWNQGSFDMEVVSDEYVVHVNQPEDTRTVQEIQALAAEFREAFPDLQMEVPDSFATDDRVALRYQWTGTHEGEILGIEGTGTTVEVNGMGHFRVEDGQLVEAWYVEDVLGLLEQLRGSTA